MNRRGIGAGLALTISCAWLLSACHSKLVNPFPDNFVGVGVELTMADDAPTVVRTLSGGPAEEAGLTPNDRVVAIDKTPTQGLTLADVVVRLRGKEGSPVVLTVRRNGVDIQTQLVRRDMTRTDRGYTARQ